MLIECTYIFPRKIMFKLHFLDNWNLVHHRDLNSTVFSILVLFLKILAISMEECSRLYSNNNHNKKNPVRRVGPKTARSTGLNADLNYAFITHPLRSNSFHGETARTSQTIKLTALSFSGSDSFQSKEKTCSRTTDNQKPGISSSSSAPSSTSPAQNGWSGRWWLASQQEK